MAKVWKINSVEYKTTGTNGANEIDVVHFSVTDTVDGITKTCYDLQHLQPNASGSFDKMEDCSEEQILNWVKQTMGSDRVAYHEQKVDDAIQAEKIPPRGEKVFNNDF